MILDLTAFKARIKNEKPEGWYIFAGEEDYLKSYYSKELSKLILPDDALDVFNHAEWCGAEIDFLSLAESIQSPPMMQDFKLIEWRFANLNDLSEKEIKILAERIFPLKEEYPSSVFVITTTDSGFDMGTEKKRSELFKAFSSSFDILSFPKSTDAQLLSWLKKHFDKEGIAVTLESLNTMLQRVGHSMELLKNEVVKLSSYLHANDLSALTPETVEEVSSLNIENESFAIQNAVFDGDMKKAFRVLLDLRSRKTEPQMVIGMLVGIYTKLSSVAMLSSEGVPTDEIGKLLRLAPYPLKLNLKAAKRIGTKNINESLKELLRIDVSAKQGGISGFRAIEIFLTQNIR